MGKKTFNVCNMVRNRCRDKVLQQRSEAEHARVRRYHLSNEENGGVTIYVAFTISVKESENNKTDCKGLSHYSCKNKCYNNVEYRNFDLNIKILI